ncbi:MAG TPA: hypothetical protein DCZ94_19635 [Lentisphaeria bacterium]|nr:MAG: hypothetical protein A2X48_23690 [Lentisphaerae bacterium GWF2_49_21]HBC89157.1 hypothetical protein [Lentisphaeria bacterium]
MDSVGLQNGFEKSVLRKDRTFVLLAAGMVLPAAFLLSATLNLPHVMIICAIGLIISFAMGKAVKFTDRSVIYSIVASLVLSVILDLAFPVDKNRFILLGDIFSTNITAPFLLYMAVLITFFEFNPYSTGVAASFSLFAVMLSSDITLNTQQTEGLLFFTAHTKSFNKIFAATIITEVIFILLALQPRKLLCTSISGKWEKRLVLVFAIVFTVFIGISGYHLFRAFEDDIRRIENMFLRIGMRRYSNLRYVVFSKEVNLNRLLSSELEKNKAVVVLRAEAKSAPGYLRGRAYTNYRDGKWTTPDVSFQKMLFTSYEGVIAFKSFYHKGGEKNSSNPVSIYPSRRFSSDVLLVPGSGNRFDIVADRLSFSPDGVLVPEEWEKDGGYTVFLPKYSGDSAYPGPENPEDPNLLQVPRGISKDISPMLSSIVPGKDASDREVLRQISLFMHNYKYSTDVDEPPIGVDPAMNFLMNTKSGHCELFATATVLLLRQQGIPARYVTGFVCEEAHPSRRYYLSRLGDAHAWAEAYIKGEGKWILVENTPPSGIPSRQEIGFWDTWMDRIKEIFQTGLADLRRGYFAKAVIDIVSALVVLVKDFVWHPFRGIGCLVLIGAGIIYFMRRRETMLRLKSEISPETAVLRLEYLRLEKFIRRKRGASRPKNMTVSEWIGGFSVSDDMLAKFAEISRKYVGMRFRQRNPTDAEIGDFRKCAREFMRSH